MGHIVSGRITQSLQQAELAKTFVAHHITHRTLVHLVCHLLLTALLSDIVLL